MADTSSRIHSAYIKPLRSVLVVDDRFPRYEELLSDNKPREDLTRPYDSQLAGDVVSFLRKHNLMCDVENRSKEITIEMMDQLTNSDLLVLDYHLTPGNDSDPSEALRIIAHLADAPRANLVIVYTSLTELEAVRRQVAFYLRGKTAKGGEPHEAALIDWAFQPTSTLLDLYIQNNLEWKRNLAVIRKELSELAIPLQDQTDVIERALERFLSKALLVSETPRNVQLSDTGAAYHWVHSGNVFVAFASKNDTDILNRLEAALLAWDPPVLQVLLAHARNELDAGGFEMQKAILGNSDTHVAWIYHALAGEEPSKEKRLEQLFGRLVSSLGQKLVSNLSEAGESLLPEIGSNLSQQEKMNVARELARDKRGLDQEAILHSLNAFLCSENYEGTHIKTGTVFRSQRLGSMQVWDWWVCIEPSCDMMPRETKDKLSWKHDLDPLFPMEALRLMIEAKPRSSLRDATQCRHIYLNVKEEEVTLRVSDATTHQPRPEMLLVRNRAQTSADGKFKVHRVKRKYLGEYTEPVYEEIECEAVAQLRTAYSDRIMHEAGYHGARVGVDFVNAAVSSTAIG